jgi:hypothetical protein
VVHLKGAEERLRPVPRVLELPAAPPAGRRGAIREAAFQRLHARLLVDREHHRARRGLQIQGGNFRHLLAELRIRAVEPALDPMRPQIAVGEQALVTAPADAVHEAAADRFVDQFRDRARRLARARLHRLAGEGDQLQPRDGGKLRGGSGPRLVVQPVHPVASKPGPPALDGARVNPHAPGYGRGTTAVFRAQDDAGSPSVALTTGPGPNSPLQFGTLLGVQPQPDPRPAATGHAPTASWSTARAQLFSAPRARSVPADFSGGTRGSGH